MNARSQLGSGGLRERLRPFDPHRQSWSSWTPLLDRLGFLIDYQGPGACSQWRGSLDAYGYGQVGFAGRPLKVHRAVYELLVGPIPDGMDIDHICHNNDPTCVGGPSCAHRACCEESHLVISTRRVNVLAGVGRSAVNKRKTHCIRGHAFTPENTAVYSGKRRCKTCDVARVRLLREVRRAH